MLPRAGSLSPAGSEAGSRGRVLSLGQAQKQVLAGILRGRFSRACSEAGSHGHAQRQVLTGRLRGTLSRAGSLSRACSPAGSLSGMFSRAGSPSWACSDAGSHGQAQRQFLIGRFSQQALLSILLRTCSLGHVLLGMFSGILSRAYSLRHVLSCMPTGRLS